MSTRAYVRYVREVKTDSGDRVETKAAVLHRSDGYPAGVVKLLDELRSVDVESATGYAAAHALARHSEDELRLVDEDLLDGYRPAPSWPSWAYEVVVDAKHLSEWQVRVSANTQAADTGAWAIDAPASVVLPYLRQIKDKKAFRALEYRYNEGDDLRDPENYAPAEVGR